MSTSMSAAGTTGRIRKMTFGKFQKIRFLVKTEFSVDPKLKLTGVPTLLKYGAPQKLVEDQLFKPDLIKMLFEED